MLVVDGDSGSEVWSVSVPCHLRETPTTSAMTSDKKSVFLFWAQALPTAVSELKARAGSVVGFICLDRAGQELGPSLSAHLCLQLGHQTRITVVPTTTTPTLSPHSQASSCCSVGERDVYQPGRGAGLPEGRADDRVVHPRKVGPWWQQGESLPALSQSTGSRTEEAGSPNTQF